MCFADAGLFISGSSDETLICHSRAFDQRQKPRRASGNLTMDPIKNIVAEVIGRMSSQQGASFQNIQQAWMRISGGKGSRVADLQDGCVTIYADTSMRMVRLNLNRQSLLQQLNQEFPSIKKICFKVGNVA